MIFTLDNPSSCSLKVEIIFANFFCQYFYILNNTSSDRYFFWLYITNCWLNHQSTDVWYCQKKIFSILTDTGGFLLIVTATVSLIIKNQINNKNRPPEMTPFFDLWENITNASKWFDKMTAHAYGITTYTVMSGAS